MKQDTTKKVNTSLMTDRGQLVSLLRLAILSNDEVAADAIRYQLSMLDSNRAEAGMLLKAHERDQMNKGNS